MFSEQGYGGNDGTMEFNGPWIEMGESNGPASGIVRVWPHEYCDGGYCLKMGGSDDDAAGHGAYRAVDLTGATSAMLSLDDGRQLLDDDSTGTAVVQISADGGGSWKTLDTITLERDDGAVSFHRKYIITDFATPGTVIRFKITDAEDLEAYWIIDNVVIEATFEEPTTTTSTTKAPATTTTTSTTKTPEPTTTTSTTKTPEPTTTTSTTKTPEPTTTTSTTKTPATTTSTHPRDEEKKTSEKPGPPVGTTTTTSRPNTTTTSRVATTTTTEAPAIFGSGVPPDSWETMMGKTALAVPAASGVTAMPASMSGDSTAEGLHIEPLAAFAAAFTTESGNYGGSLVPSFLLGIVIAVVSLLGIRSRREEQ
jgi:hypothetical protein